MAIYEHALSGIIMALLNSVANFPIYQADLKPDFITQKNAVQSCPVRCQPRFKGNSLLCTFDALSTLLTVHTLSHQIK